MRNRKNDFLEFLGVSFEEYQMTKLKGEQFTPTRTLEECVGHFASRLKDGEQVDGLEIIPSGHTDASTSSIFYSSIEDPDLTYDMKLFCQMFNLKGKYDILNLVQEQRSKKLRKIPSAKKEWGKKDFGKY